MKLTQSFRAVSIVAILLVSGCAFLKKRPPYPDPDRLVSVVKIGPAGEEPILKTDFLALRSENQTLESVAAYVLRGFTLSSGSEPERINTAMVSAEFFHALGVNVSLGRAINSADCQPGSNPVLVINYSLWQRRYGGDPNIIGRIVTLDHKRRTIIGVMPFDFEFPKECDVWAPLAFDDENMNFGEGNTESEVIARLKPGVTLQQAQTEMSNIARNLEREYPATNSGRDIKLLPLRESRSKREKVLEIKIRRPAPPPAETGKEK